ncbi:MAG: hypothetical protein ACLTTH_10460 [Holdemanella porci]
MVPGFFGINEPIIFGLPVVLNPVIAIPFILVPMMNLILSYFRNFVGYYSTNNRCKLTLGQLQLDSQDGWLQDLGEQVYGKSSCWY